MKISFLPFASFLLFSSVAVANPIRTLQELSASAIAGVHVKLTYTYNDGDVTSSVTTHGTSHSPWVSAAPTTADLGSGFHYVSRSEMCDCHVPTGTRLDYIVYTTGPMVSIGAQVQVASQVDFDEVPTSQDCIIPCQQADADAADAGRKSDAGGAPVTQSSGSGCAVVAPGTSPALLALALFGLGIAVRRRRR